MSDLEAVQPGATFQKEWSKWQKQLREWRQGFDDWRQVLQQLQEWDEKDSKGIVLASLDPNFDVFAVKDISDIGEGEPLTGNFEFEDWALLSLKVELHLLVHNFRNDTGGAVLDESNLAHYYNCYFQKDLKPEDFAVKSFGEVIQLVQDSVTIGEHSLLEQKLPEDTPFVKFLKLTEQGRRDRNQAAEAGDETVFLSFPGAQKDAKPAKKKPQVQKAQPEETDGYQGERGSRGKRPPPREPEPPAKAPRGRYGGREEGGGPRARIPNREGYSSEAPRTRYASGPGEQRSEAPRTRYAERSDQNSRPVFGERERRGPATEQRHGDDRYGDRPARYEGRDRYDDREEDRYGERTRGSYEGASRGERYSERDGYGEYAERPAYGGRQSERSGYGSEKAHDTYERRPSYGAAPRDSYGSAAPRDSYGRDPPSAYSRSAPPQDSYRDPPPRDSYGRDAPPAYNRAAPPRDSYRDAPSHDSYGRDAASAYSSRGAATYGRETPSAYSRGGAPPAYERDAPPAYGRGAPSAAPSSYGQGPGQGAPAAYGKGRPPAYGRAMPPAPAKPKVELDPLDAFMAGIESHGDSFAKGEVQEAEASRKSAPGPGGAASRYGGPAPGSKGAAAAYDAYGKGSGPQRSAPRGRVNPSDL
eukprot:TRINITY_DN50177_c0_g1_i1.p1 TRINITY_DN50177_c0_g1~~TRINITY_DN50177_c0_g1_i1.p1  ORF type:complete len:643 (-),score=126.80 TRINITY_DN50177_c0_g1_i1:13-1941(-)